MDSIAALHAALERYVRQDIILTDLYTWLAEQDEATDDPARDELAAQVWQGVHAVYAEGRSEASLREEIEALLPGVRVQTWQGPALASSALTSAQVTGSFPHVPSWSSIHGAGVVRTDHALA